MNLNYQDVKTQSTAVFKQFGESKWKPFAMFNSKLPNRRNAEELRNSGVGKILVSAGLGQSLEAAIPHLKKYRNRFDLICCDKGLKVFLDHGIKPDYVMLADCNILWQKWAPEERLTEGVKLIASPYANISWTRKWRGPIYFYCNRDAIDSQQVFEPIMGPGTRSIPASSNVSNAQVVFWTGFDEWITTSFGGYEKILLTGYDYCWKPGKNYYAFYDPKPKRYYMNHMTVVDINKDIAYTSDNLLFSCRWMMDYCKVFGEKANIINCSEQGLLIARISKLLPELEAIRPDMANQIRSAWNIAALAKRSLQEASNVLNMQREVFYGAR